MGVKVEFNIAGFRARYPEFAAVSDGFLTACFDEATIYHRNDGGGPVSTAAIQSTLLNMATAHIAWMGAPRAAGVPDSAGTPPPPIVGRISSASEGSVSVQADIGSPSAMAAWWSQTPYGFSYWQATATYRTFRYLPASQRNFTPYPFVPFRS